MTKYDEGTKTFVYDPSYDAPMPCIICKGDGHVPAGWADV